MRVGKEVGPEEVGMEVGEKREAGGGGEGLQRQEGGAPGEGGGICGAEANAKEGVQVEGRGGACGTAEGVEEFAGGEVLRKGHGE